MRILIDRTAQRVLEADGYRLDGECLKCGACCELNRGNCRHLVREAQDGMDVRICAIYRDRPWYCAFYPCDPHSREDPPPGCGFRWVKIDN